MKNLTNKQLEDIAGAWNGDEPGLQEDRAMEAMEELENRK